MAIRRENLPNHKSIVMEDDGEINIQNNRTTTNIKSRIFIAKNNERVVSDNKSLI